ncbi:hypothetical protein EG327_007245 [Venturia inaequalis]|nr:hypothetical protein EG327_007245 [Venturia inaequalis]
MRETSAKAVPKWYQAMPTHAGEVEKMIEAMVTIMRKDRISKRSVEQDRKAEEEQAFIAQMAARFAKEERELTDQEDFYQHRDPSEDSLPPLVTSMEGLMQRNARIEARRRRVTAHKYRNSPVTSTTTPNADNPSKSSLDNPIIDIAIDQFLTQDPEKLETLHQKLGKLCGIAMERAERLGLEGVTEDDSYLLKHVRTSKPPPVETYWTDRSGEDESTASFNVKDYMSEAEGIRSVVECADATLARCQHHSCQPIQTRSRRSSMFSDRTSYGPFPHESDAPAEDMANSEEPSPGQTSSFQEESLAKCVYMNVAYFDWENPVGSLLEPIARAVYELDKQSKPLSDEQFEQAYVDEFHKMGEHDHWKLQTAINLVLQDTAPHHALQHHWAQDLRVKVFDARNPEQSSNVGNNRPPDRATEKYQEKPFRHSREKIEQAAGKAEQTIKGPHNGLDKHIIPNRRAKSKQAKHVAKGCLRAKKLMYRKKAKQPTISDAADTYENLQSEQEETCSTCSTSSTSGSSNSSDVVKPSNHFGKMTEDQRREWFKNVGKTFREDLAKSGAAEINILQKRNADIRARNNIKNVEESDIPPPNAMIKRLMSLNRSKQPTVEDYTGVEDNPFLSTRTNSSLSPQLTIASKESSSLVEEARPLDSPTTNTPWMGLTPPRPSPAATCDHDDSEVEAVVFFGRSPRSSIHSGVSDDRVEIEKSDVPGPADRNPEVEKVLKEVVKEEEKEALRLEEESIMERMDEDLRAMVVGERKKVVHDG